MNTAARSVRRLSLPDVASSDAFGIALADLVVAGVTRPGTSFDGFTMHFSGDLGAGKTTVVRALLRALGVIGRIKSPTFALVESYVVDLSKKLESRQSVKLDCYHFDFYRFEDPREWLAAGFRDHFADAVLRLVEWPERAVGDDAALLPAPDVHVTIETDGPGRTATIVAGTARGDAWLTGPSDDVFSRDR